MKLTNVPRTPVPMSLAARKSFSFVVVVLDSRGERIDISGEDYRVTFVVRKNDRRVDSPNMDALIHLDAARPNTHGEAVFVMQGSQTDLPVGEYQYAITLYDHGYSLILAQGDLEIVANADYDATTVDHEEVTESTAGLIVATIADKNVLKVRTGGGFAPGTLAFTDADKAKLDTIEAGAQVNPGEDRLLPVQGQPGEHLTVDSNFEPRWTFDERYLAFEGGLEPVPGVPGLYTVSEYAPHGLEEDTPGFWNVLDVNALTNDPLNYNDADIDLVPISDGEGSWGWGSVVQSVNGQSGTDVQLTLANVPDSATRLALTPAERLKISQAITTVTSLSWDNLEDIPSDLLYSGSVGGGDIVWGQVEPAFLPKVLQLRGISAGSSAPAASFGAIGDIYLQYEGVG